VKLVSVLFWLFIFGATFSYAEKDLVYNPALFASASEYAEKYLKQYNAYSHKDLLAELNNRIPSLESSPLVVYAKDGQQIIQFIIRGSKKTFLVFSESNNIKRYMCLEGYIYQAKEYSVRELDFLLIDKKKYTHPMITKGFQILNINTYKIVYSADTEIWTETEYEDKENEVFIIKQIVFTVDKKYIFKKHIDFLVLDKNDGYKSKLYKAPLKDLMLINRNKKKDFKWRLVKK
jgi:hypothetical protein